MKFAQVLNALGFASAIAIVVVSGSGTAWADRDGGRASGTGIVPFESLAAVPSVSAQANQIPAVSQVSFPPGTFEFTDFADANLYGAYFQPMVGGLRGSGVDQTVFRMKANTSTKASSVPAQATAHTNQLDLIRIGAGGGTVRSPIVSDLTLQGTPQGHTYNGLLMYHSTAGRVTDVQVTGIPGNASSQPGETFGVNDYRSDGTVYTRLTIDGQGVGASGFGGNLGSNVSIIDSISKNNANAHGFTQYTMNNVTYRNVVSQDNGASGFNFERVSGTVIMDHCTTLGNAVPITIANDASSARFIITDPVFEGPKLVIKVTGYAGVTTTTQVVSDITLSINGINRPDLLNIVQ
jgi:hypothetical protein